MRRYSIDHTTIYEYETPVVHAHHIAHLRPRSLEYQEVQSAKISTKPAPANHFRGRDYFGNDDNRIEILEPHDLLELTANSVITVQERSDLDPPEQTWQEVRSRLTEDTNLLGASEFCYDSPLVRSHHSLRSYVQPTFTPGRPLVDAILEFNTRINTEFTYESAATDVTTPLAVVLRDRRGVCQDFAHLAVGCLRSLGLAARYVSGYLETIPPPGQPRLVGADASHAWASVFIPDYGWFDFDPTNDLLPSDRHVVVAWGRDFSDVSPLKGVVLGGGAHRLTVGVTVEPID